MGKCDVPSICKKRTQYRWIYFKRVLVYVFNIYMYTHTYTRRHAGITVEPYQPPSPELWTSAASLIARLRGSWRSKAAALEIWNGPSLGKRSILIQEILFESKIAGSHKCIGWLILLSFWHIDVGAGLLHSKTTLRTWEHEVPVRPGFFTLPEAHYHSTCCIIWRYFNHFQSDFKYWSSLKLGSTCHYRRVFFSISVLATPRCQVYWKLRIGMLARLTAPCLVDNRVSGKWEH